MNSSLPNSLSQHVERLAGLIGPRHLGRPASIDAAIALIELEFIAMGDAVRREVYPISQGLVGTNLVIERGGISRPDEIVLLGGSL